MTRFNQHAGLGRTACAVAATALLATSLACGGEDGGQASGTQAASDAGAAAEIPPLEKGTREVSLQDEGGEVKATLSAGEMPDSYPADLPVPPDAEPQNALFIPGKHGWATFTSKQERDAVKSFFEQDLPAKGWSLEPTRDEGGRITISATKEGRTAKVLIMSGDGDTSISVMLEGS